MKWMNKLLPIAMACAMLLTAPATVAAAYYPYYTNNYWYGGYSQPATTYSTTGTRTATTQTTASGVASVEQSLLQMVNRERTQRGLAPLQADSTLTNLARLKSQDMVAKNYFSHTSPTYGTPAQMLSRYNVAYKLFAENIAQGSSSAQIHSMWMNSAGHRANILNPKLTHIGIGVVAKGSNYTATQIFIAR